MASIDELLEVEHKPSICIDEVEQHLSCTHQEMQAKHDRSEENN